MPVYSEPELLHAWPEMTKRRPGCDLPYFKVPYEYLKLRGSLRLSSLSLEVRRLAATL